jgi:FkbM family methyltransferase
VAGWAGVTEGLLDVSTNLVIDVGANSGGFSLEIASRNPSVRVIAFEPEPDLAAKLVKEAERRGIGNHETVAAAVGAVTGEVPFFVSRHGDRGTSSILEFDDSHLHADEYWSRHPDLVHDFKIMVRITRLEDFLSQMDFDEILFIKIDAQGADLDVFRSLGRFMPTLKAGMLETPEAVRNALYRGEHDLRAALNALAEHGFLVHAIKPNDHAANEFNVFFYRDGVQLGELEESLGLNTLPLYNGKHYWHMPSHQLENHEGHIASLAQSRDALASQVHQLALEAAQARAEYGELRNRFLIKLLRRVRVL